MPLKKSNRTPYKLRMPLKLSRETVAELKPASTASCSYRLVVSKGKEAVATQLVSEP